MFLLRRANSVPLLLRRIKVRTVCCDCVGITFDCVSVCLFSLSQGAIEEHQPLSVLARLFDILNDVAQIAHKERYFFWARSLSIVSVLFDCLLPYNVGPASSPSSLFSFLTPHPVLQGTHQF